MKRTLIITLLAGTILAGLGVKNALIQTNEEINTNVSEATTSLLKKDVVKLYPNPSHDGKVTITSNAGQTLHFYVFDVEGTMLHQLILKDKEKQTIQNLKKGTYVYDAFLNDKGIDHGSIEVR